MVRHCGKKVASERTGLYPRVMSDEPIVCEWHSVGKRTRFLLAAVCVLAGLWIAWHATTPSMVCLAAVFGLGALAVQADQQVSIAAGSHTVSRRISLWGRVLWSSSWPVADFTGVGSYRIPAGGRDHAHELVHVGLRRATGGVLAVRYFSVRRGEPCPEAEEYARDLEERIRLTGVTMANHGGPLPS